MKLVDAMETGPKTGPNIKYSNYISICVVLLGIPGSHVVLFRHFSRICAFTLTICATVIFKVVVREARVASEGQFKTFGPVGTCLRRLQEAISILLL